MSSNFLLFAVLIGMSWAQSEIPTALHNITLPPELQGKVDPEKVEMVQNATLSEIKTRCEKNGGPEAYDKAQKAGKELEKCIFRLVNLSSLQQEVEEAKPNGRVDEVFKKYCEKKPLFEGCMKNLTDSTRPCFSENEQVHLKTIYNVSQQLADFFCFKEGDRIALFVAEGGQECFQDKREGLQDCMSKTFGINEETAKQFDVNSISNATITFDKKQCNQILDLQNCVVSVLESCPKPTSANIVESLFKFIRKSTPCKNYPDKEVKPKSHNHKAETPKGSAKTFFVTSATLITAVFVTLLI